MKKQTNLEKNAPEVVARLKRVQELARDAELNVRGEARLMFRENFQSLQAEIHAIKLVLRFGRN